MDTEAVSLRQFLDDWRKDGVALIEFMRQSRDGATWILYKATEPTPTHDYGRHYALLIVVNEADEVIAHNFHNISDNGKSFFAQAGEWWKEHLDEGLFTPEGRRICA